MHYAQYAPLKFNDDALLRQMVLIHFLQTLYDKTWFMEAILKLGQHEQGSLKK